MQDGLLSVPPARFPHDMERLRMVSALSKQLMVHQGGVELHGLPFGGAELLPMRRAQARTSGLGWWDPDDMSQIWVQDPISQQWVGSPCRWGDYANGLQLESAPANSEVCASGVQEQLGRTNTWNVRLRPCRSLARVGELEDQGRPKSSLHASAGAHPPGCSVAKQSRRPCRESRQHPSSQ